MKRNALRSFDGLDTEARAAARKAARQAGMTLDEWAAATLAKQATEAVQSSMAATPRAAARKTASGTKISAKSKAGTADRSVDAGDLDGAVAKLRSIGDIARRPAAAGAQDLQAILAASVESERRNQDQAAKTALALDSVASWIETAEDRLTETSRLTVERQERTAAMLGEALALMTRRLDEIDRKVADGAQPCVEAALKAIERIESHLHAVDEERSRAQTAQIETALQGFEDRIAELTERLAANARPGARRPIGSEELSSAVAEIRARQDHLDQGGSPDTGQAGEMPLARSHAHVLQALRGDIARLAGKIDTARPGDAAHQEAAAVRAEIERLQTMVGGLATRGEVAALEHSLRELAVQVAEARVPGDLAAVTRPVEELHAEIRHLSELATGDHGRFLRDVEALTRKIDAVAESGVDPGVVGSLSQQLADVHELIAEMAEPQRVRDLVEEVAELNRRLADLSRRQIEADEFTRRFDGLARKLDDLHHRPMPEADASPDLGEQIEALSVKLDRLSEKPRITLSPASEGLDALARRLDRIDESLNRSMGRELKPIEDMLRTLVDRIDQAERPNAGAGALDALEKQVALLARRLERGASDPALASLERTMNELMAQIEAMRTGANEATERAVRTAVADTIAALPLGAQAPEVGTLKRDLADFKTHRSAADQRMQLTLESVHRALERVVARLATIEEEAASERLGLGFDGEDAAAARITTLPPREGSPVQRGNPAPDLAFEEADRPVPPASLDEVLLEPGAARPRPSAAAHADDAGGGASNDIKANFIAAARRAAQAAAAEAAAAKGKTPASEGAKANLAARVRRALDKHRRPILLGLAAIVLALGALQTARMTGRSTLATAESPKVETHAPRPAPLAASPADPRDGGTKSAEPQPSLERPDEPVEPAAKRPDDRTSASAQPTRDALPVQPAMIEDGSPDAKAAAPAAKAPLPIAPPAPSAPTTSDARAPALERIAQVSSVGEIPTAPNFAGLRHAALAGDPIAVYELAARLAEGRGFARDTKLAAKLFEKAAAVGLAPAQYRIGNHYEKGLGVTRDAALAKTWYERAAEKGNARAMHNLAVLSAEGSDGRPDYARAVEWFRRAAEHGVKDSQFNLAVLLARGMGAPQDLSKSYTWFAIAAAAGDEDAAKKRDEVGSRMTTANVSSAKAAAERFRATVPDRHANEVALPSEGWAEPPAPQKAPASAHSPGTAGKRV